MKVDDKVWFLEPEQEVWHPAHFAEFKFNGLPVPSQIGVWIQGRTSHSAFGKISYYDKWHSDREHKEIRNEWNKELTESE